MESQGKSLAVGGREKEKEREKEVRELCVYGCCFMLFVCCFYVVCMLFVYKREGNEDVHQLHNRGEIHEFLDKKEDGGDHSLLVLLYLFFIFIFYFFILVTRT